MNQLRLVNTHLALILSYLTFAAIKATIGLRVSEDEEEAGLDIVEHGMYGYPELFIPPSEIGAGPQAAPVARPAPSGVTAATTRPGEVTA